MKKNRLKRTLATGLALSMALTIGVSASAKTLTLPNSGYTLEVGDAAPEKSANANSIGGNTQSNTQMNGAWCGEVSLARIYDAPLTADEVKALYEDVRE